MDSKQWFLLFLEACTFLFVFTAIACIAFVQRVDEDPNKKAFRKHKKDLEQTFCGQYAAFACGMLIDVDQDYQELIKKVTPRVDRYTRIWVKKIGGTKPIKLHRPKHVVPN